MFLDIILGLTFLGSLFILWYRVSEKIPELALVPDAVIADRLKEDSARVRFFILHIKTFYKEKHYRDIVFKFLSKTLYKLHILLLRLDNAVVGSHKKFKENGNIISESTEAVVRPEVIFEPQLAPVVESVTPAVIIREEKKHHDVIRRRRVTIERLKKEEKIQTVPEVSTKDPINSTTHSKIEEVRTPVVKRKKREVMGFKKAQHDKFMPNPVSNLNQFN